MILIYLLKVSACSAIIFAVYHLLLARLTFFNINRAYLLVGLVICFTIPALTFESQRVVLVKQEAPLKLAYHYDGLSEKEFADHNPAASFADMNWEKIIVYSYYAIVAFLLLRMLFIACYIKLQLHKYKISEMDHILLVDPKSPIKNCSFFNQIIIDAALPPEERVLVIRHESIHVAQMHAFDKILINIVAAVLWFNPVIYFWRSAIDHNHEFLADRETSKTTDKQVYASLLLQLALPSKSFAVNSFSKLPLKSRIIMMYKKPDSGIRKLTYLVVLPVLMFCCMAFVSQKEILVEQKVPAANKVKQDVETKTSVVNVGSPKNDSIASKTPAEDQNVKPENNQLENTISENQLAFFTSNPLHINAEITTHIAKELMLVVDAGHGGRDGAAKSAAGIKEKDLNLRAVQILKEEADRRKIKVVLTRNKDVMIPLRDRLPDENATAFISIHHNSYPTAMAKNAFEGIEVMVSQLNPKIKMAEFLGMDMLSNLNKLTGIEVRDSLKDANLLLLRESRIPAIVIELGNISSEQSLAYVSEEKNLRRICNLILDGFVAFSNRGC